ncbi:hypothetical protein ACFLVC_04480 [Chloroflexota bacterium]
MAPFQLALPLSTAVVMLIPCPLAVNRPLKECLLAIADYQRHHPFSF